MNNIKSNLIIAALIILAIVLGYFIFQKFQSSSGSNYNLEQNIQAQPTQIQKQTLIQRRPTPTDLTADEKILMNPPDQNAAPQQMKGFFELVKKLAKKAEVLDINKCDKSSPFVFEAKLGQNIQVRNSDTADHTIMLRLLNFSNKIPAGQTKAIKADFGKGAGAYGYICDNIGGVVGYVFVTP